MVKESVKQAIEKVIEQTYHHKQDVILTAPSDLHFGDYTTNVAMILAKELSAVPAGRQVNPREIADKIANGLEQEGKGLGINKIDIAGPGFINISLNEEKIINHIDSMTRDGEKIADIGKNKIVVVEYSSPNIAKPFTIGHLRSTVIGDAIANLLEATGWQVKRDNHVGDWGTQFGKQIYALIHLGGGNLEANLKNIEASDRPVQILVQLYVEFHEKAKNDPSLEDSAREWFKKLEDGDAKARDLWQKCIDWSWKEFNAIYEQLGVKFTENNGRGYGESFFEDKMASVVAELQYLGLLKDSEGAKLVFFPNDEYPPLMIIKKDGTTLYATRDLATDRFRLKQYGTDISIINEVGAEQSLYFQQLYALERMLGWFHDHQRTHVKHGLYRFKEGKMSTRKGNTIWLEDVLEEAKQRALELGKKGTKETDEPKEEGYADKLAQLIAIGALKWNDLKRSSHEDVAFDWDTILSMEGNSGPYIQYTYARTQSVLRKSETRNSKLEINWKLENKKWKMENEEVLLLRLLYRFDDIVIQAAEKYSPNILANYLFELAQQYNLFYQKVPMLKSEGETKEFRLWLNSATGTILKRGLALLGIQSPEKM